MPTRATAILHAVAFVAVLAGLFAMHGIAHPGGCHTGDTASAMQSHSSHLEPVVAHTAPSSDYGVAMGTATTHFAADCVATPRRTSTQTLVGVVLVAVMAVAAVLGSAAPPGRRRDGSLHDSRRAPPVWGVGLLLHACVSRT